MLRPLALLPFWLGSSLLACSGTRAVAIDGGASTMASEAGADPPEAGKADVPTGPVDASTGDARDASAKDRGVCASRFGAGLTAGFGRLDGTVLALQIPSDRGCVMPNNDHVILQVRMAGDVYRMVINVQSDRAGKDPRVRFGLLETALPAPAWSEGWHLAAPLGYAALGAKPPDFTPLEMDQLIARMVDAIAVGDRVAVYGRSGPGRPSSAHLIHRNAGTTEDGAVVLSPDTARARFLMFHFEGQTF